MRALNGLHVGALGVGPVAMKVTKNQAARLKDYEHNLSKYATGTFQAERARYQRVRVAARELLISYITCDLEDAADGYPPPLNNVQGESGGTHCPDSNELDQTAAIKCASSRVLWSWQSTSNSSSSQWIAPVYFSRADCDKLDGGFNTWRTGGKETLELESRSQGPGLSSTIHYTKYLISSMLYHRILQ